MPIEQIHLNSCNSTQEEIKKKINQKMNSLHNHDEILNLLISTENQIKGYGRSNNKWDYFKGSLAFSFSILPSDPITLTTIELSILIKNYLEDTFSLKNKISLKWPNDLFLNGLKLGGILVDLSQFSYVTIALAGVGINFSKNKYFSNIDILDNNFLIKNTSYKIYEFILNNRINKKKIISEFSNSCFHLNKRVQIDGVNGNFNGITNLGEAILQTNHGLKTFSCGPLVVL